MSEPWYEFQAEGPNGPPVKIKIMGVVLIYFVSLVVIVTVLHHLYAHHYHFTPPALHEYQERMAARRLMERGALQFGESDRYSSVPPGSRGESFRLMAPHRGGGGGGGGGAAAAGGSARHEIQEVELGRSGNYSADAIARLEEDLARLEQDLRATSFRERERLLAALEADLPDGQSFLFPVRSSSSQTMLLPELDATVNGLSRASQSARISRGTVTPSPGSFRVSAARGGSERLPPHAQSFFFPPELDLSIVRQASHSARFSDLSRASRPARIPRSASAELLTSTSGAGWSGAGWSGARWSGAGWSGAGWSGASGSGVSGSGASGSAADGGASTSSTGGQPLPRPRMSTVYPLSNSK